MSFLTSQIKTFNLSQSKNEPISKVIKVQKKSNFFNQLMAAFDNHVVVIIISSLSSALIFFFLYICILVKIL